MQIDIVLRNLSSKLWGAEAVEFMASDVRDSLHRWYASLPEDWFDNKRPFPDGTPRHAGKRTFMQPLSTAWRTELQNDGFSVYFAQRRDGGAPWGLRLQQYGGEIVPKRRRALTIPVTAEARGLSAHAFEQQTGRDLFMVKGKAAPDKIGSLVWEDPQGDLHAAYVLRKRANVPPLKERRGHDAIPSDAQFVAWTNAAYEKFLKYTN